MLSIHNQTTDTIDKLRIIIWRCDTLSIEHTTLLI
ncbi:Uncharacterised protein [Vibrio cholerae]|nr:Uncharacterised protein [Vibrio cholerae]CSI50536.1 Uncharacterised protein [Vibrio cholerae]CSI57052.1 Uncharacterised protein [Vibrio cholerae]